MTKDGRLICSHDPTLKTITDIAEHPEFADRMKASITFGAPYHYHYTDDWLINDFTLEELLTLRKKERYSKRNQAMDGLYQFVTVEEAIEFQLRLNKEKPSYQYKTRPTGLYIETKMWQFYQDRKIDIATMLYDVLTKYELNTVAKAEALMPIILECFEGGSLKVLKEITDLPLVFLMGHHELVEAMAMIKDAATFAHAIGPTSSLVVDGQSKLIKDLARNLGLAMHPWYVRDDFLTHEKTASAENMIYYNMGMDGIFSEFTHTTQQTYLDAAQKSTPDLFIQ